MNKEEIHKTTIEEYSHAINKYVDIMDCEDAYKINDYVSNLEYDNQKYKEVIDKAIKHVSSLSSKGRDCRIYANVKKDILDILKEVK